MRTALSLCLTLMSCGQDLPLEPGKYSLTFLYRKDYFPIGTSHVGQFNTAQWTISVKDGQYNIDTRQLNETAVWDGQVLFFDHKTLPDDSVCPLSGYTFAKLTPGFDSNTFVGYGETTATISFYSWTVNPVCNNIKLSSKFDFIGMREE